MKLRIQNNAKGGRGIWVDGALVEVAPGSTATYPKVSAGERDAIAANSDFRVWVDTGAGWEEISTLPEVAKDRPFLAVASGARGEGMRVVDLADGEWFVGTAIAPDKPDGARGYSWSRVGVGSPSEPVSGKFDPAAYVQDVAVDVIAGLEGKTPEQLTAILTAENAREKPRKGVTSAVEEMLGKSGSEDNA